MNLPIIRVQYLSFVDVFRSIPYARVSRIGSVYTLVFAIIIIFGRGKYAKSSGPSYATLKISP